MTYFLTRSNMNTTVALNGNVESTEYRYQVFPGYRTWVRQHMHLNNEARMEIFTPVKDQAVKMILDYRHEVAQSQAKNAATQSSEDELWELIKHQSVTIGMQVEFVDNAKARVAELEALMAQKDAKHVEEVSALKAENKSLKTTISSNNRTIRNQSKTLEVVTNKLEKVTTKLNTMWSLKEVQATYMRVKHGVVQKVKG